MPDNLVVICCCQVDALSAGNDVIYQTKITVKRSSTTVAYDTKTQNIVRQDQHCKGGYAHTLVIENPFVGTYEAIFQFEVLRESSANWYIRDATMTVLGAKR